MKNKLVTQLLMFGIVGAVGFVVDTGVLYAALGIGFGHYGGRVISYLCAATTTWYLNRRWTFKNSGGTGSRKAEWGRFLFLNLGGFAVNYGTYALMVGWLKSIAIHPNWIPLLAVAAGSVAGLFVNFTINKYLVFRPDPSARP